MTIHDEPTLPHGGFKSSGFGRFNGKWAVESFTQTKTITTSKGQELPLGMLA
jgi:acyl-CoA reductase-like NAD-dependent aldehyde dehydrogenase